MFQIQAKVDKLSFLSSWDHTFWLNIVLLVVCKIVHFGQRHLRACTFWSLWVHTFCLLWGCTFCCFNTTLATSGKPKVVEVYIHTQSNGTKIESFLLLSSWKQTGLREEMGKVVGKIWKRLKYNGVDPGDRNIAETAQMALLIYAGSSIEDLQDTLPTHTCPTRITNTYWTIYFMPNQNSLSHLISHPSSQTILLSTR